MHRSRCLSTFVACVGLATLFLCTTSCTGDSPEGPGRVDTDLRQIPLVGWTASVAPTANYYTVGTDRRIRASGNASVRLNNEQATGSFTQEGRISQRIRADAYRGRRVRLVARMRADTVAAAGAGPFLWVDRPSGSPV